MPKNIQCGQCKYCKRLEADSSQEINLLHPPFQPPHANYYCEADKNIYLWQGNLSDIRNCQFYRSASKTARQEVAEDIITKIPNLLGKILFRK